MGQPTLTVINDSEIRVNWDAPTSPGTPITFYRVRYNDGSGNTLTPQLPADQTQYTLTGLDASTEYSIQVRAWNAEGRSPSWSTPALATTDAPASTVPHTPAAPTLAAQSTSAIRAEWVAPNDGGEAIESYSIRWRIGSGAYATQNGLTALAYDIVGLFADTEYSVSVRAVNSVGSSAWSAEAMESTDSVPVPLFMVLDDEDPNDGHVRAFMLDGTRVAARDIPNLGDADWEGITSDATRIWVIRTDAPDRALAYDHAGARHVDDDLVPPTAPATIPRGVAVNTDAYFIASSSGSQQRVYKYLRSDDSYDTSGPSFGSATPPNGVTADDMWVIAIRSDGRIWQLTVDDLVLDPSRIFETWHLQPGGHRYALRRASLRTRIGERGSGVDPRRRASRRPRRHARAFRQLAGHHRDRRVGRLP